MHASTVARVLVATLRGHGVDTVFCVPGESYLPVLDALYEERAALRTVACRLEIGAAFMAEAWGKLGRGPGVLAVTRGPGACNASIGVHTALQDSTPMVVLIGQVPRSHSQREAFQEIDYRAFYAPLTKEVLVLDRAERVGELTARAVHTALSGRPGPVALVLPEDVLAETIDALPPEPAPVTTPAPGADAMARLRDLLAAARRPLMVLGGGGWTAPACDAIARFATANALPVAAAFRRQDRIDNDHPGYVGVLGLGAGPDLLARVRDADLLLVVGARLGAMTTGGYTLVRSPVPAQRLVHVHPDPDEIGRVYRPSLAICAGAAGFAAAAAALDPIERPAWGEWTAMARAEYLATLEPSRGPDFDLDPAAVIAHLRTRLPDDAVVTTDAGNFSGWVNRFFPVRRFPGLLGTTNGAMGYGVPAAIAARLADRGRPAVAICGDGGVLMTGQELATAVHHGIDPVVIVLDNGMYGTIRVHQERSYPGRVNASALTNPAFAIWAQSFGAYGEEVARTEDFPDALERALGAGRAALLALRVDPELASTRTTLSAIREAGRRE